MKKKKDQLPDLDELLKLDKYNLDTEWVNHSDYVYMFLDEQAEARIKMDAMKDNIEVVKAELDKAIRNNPKKFNLDKLTEVLINNTIILQEDYGKALKDYLDAKGEYYDAVNISTAMEHRKAALENLVVLHGRGYWADPVEKKDPATKAATDNIKKKTKKIKKEKN